MKSGDITRITKKLDIYIMVHNWTGKKWESIFQSRKKQGILHRPEKSGNFKQNTDILTLENWKKILEKSEKFVNQKK